MSKLTFDPISENIDAQLKRMVSDLREIIDHLNANNSMAAGDGTREGYFRIFIAIFHFIDIFPYLLVLSKLIV